MFKHKLSIPSRNLCQVVLDVFVLMILKVDKILRDKNVPVDRRELISNVAIQCRSLAMNFNSLSYVCL